MDTAAMIDYMLVRYKSSESDARANCLKWLNDAQEKVWYLADWWFRKDRDDFAFLTGIKTYNVAAGTLEVLDLYDSSDQPLVYIPYNTFYAVYGGAADAGEPQAWTHGTRNVTTGLQSVVVYPTPDQDYSGVILRDIAHTELSDAAASVSLLPEQHHRILPTKALAEMARDENKPAMHKEFQDEFDRLLADMLAADARHKRGK